MTIKTQVDYNFVKYQNINLDGNFMAKEVSVDIDKKTIMCAVGEKDKCWYVFDNIGWFNQNFKIMENKEIESK